MGQCFWKVCNCFEDKLGSSVNDLLYAMNLSKSTIPEQIFEKIMDVIADIVQPGKKVVKGEKTSNCFEITSLKDLGDQLEDGDILLLGLDEGLGKLIEIPTNSNLAHCQMCLLGPDGKKKIFEATIVTETIDHDPVFKCKKRILHINGIGWTDYEDRFKGMMNFSEFKWGFLCRLDFTKLKVNKTDFLKNVKVKANEIYANKDKIKYDIFQNIIDGICIFLRTEKMYKLASHIQMYKDYEDYNCSELMGVLLQAGGVLDEKLNCSPLSPQDICDYRIFEEKYGRLVFLDKNYTDYYFVKSFNSVDRHVIVKPKEMVKEPQLEEQVKEVTVEVKKETVVSVKSENKENVKEKKVEIELKDIETE